MKNLFFAILLFGGLFTGNAQTNWETDGNCAPYGQFELPPELVLGTRSNCLVGGNGGIVLDFNIIRGGMTMASFLQDLVILAPNTSTKVLIGDPATTTTPGIYKLYVEDGIMTEKVKVALKTTSDWSDYVFENEYELMTLNELEVFIDTYGHLPNIPSAKELVKKGLDLGAMQAKQMAKIEELTLHLIQKNKEIEALQKQVAILSGQMKLLLEKQ